MAEPILIAGGPASLEVAQLQLAGGGDFSKMPQQQTIIQVVAPPVDYTLIMVTGVLVPLLIAMVGWWLQHRWRKQNPDMQLTWENVKKSRDK
jgi:hypothetical protein